MAVDVSVIVPTLNEEKCIERSLKSIRAQTTRLSYEVIVVDGHSKDRTVEIARKYAKIVNRKTLGIANARNLGAEHAQGQLLVFIDADTEIPPDYMDKVWNYMVSHGDVVALTARIEYTFKKRYVRTMWRVLELWLRMWSLFGRGMLVGVNMAVWKDVFEKVGGFPDVPSEDVAIKSLLLRHGKTVYFMGTHSITSSRRFDEDPFGMVPYYLFRDVVTRLRMSRLEGAKKMSQKMEKRMKKVVEYKPIR